ncbi:signal transduction histidine kinase [Caulobacter ginsengisoli]|uniref:histidine kinase n=1 Tax=Caulobacter ginsengisoli TaxID=400775 RepID=A0ABU0INB3_9CAUL|nr:HAMP domain-containing sensor histidine kinase [Caulobacter ginsengisoli]MDQ0463492.1 signal transduction histidine kinase [Caulobacter ginsengisoli]
MSNLARQTPSPNAAAEVDLRETRLARREAALDANKRSFLRMVSHELRTPLNAVIGFSEILATELYGPLGSSQYQEYAQLIHQSGHRLLALVNQVMEIARLEGHALDMDVRPEAVDHAIEDALETLGEAAADRGLRIVVNDSAHQKVMADGRGLRTMLSNLLQNAVAWSPDGGLIRIDVRRCGASIEIEIADQGPGIPAADIHRLMRPFEQGEDALTRSSQGAGLGLPIVQLLCKAMGGHLRLRSPPGQGLSAIVSLHAA